MGLHAEAQIAFERAVDLDSQFWPGWWSLGFHYSGLGRPDTARTSAERGYAIHPNPYTIGLLAGVLQNVREHARSDTLLEEIRASSEGAPVALACFHLGAGDVDQALAFAGQALDEGYPMMTNMFIRPYEIQLRASPAWGVLMRKLNVPETYEVRRERTECE